MNTRTLQEEYDARLRTWKARAFSWSQLSSFEFNPEQWYRNYFLGERDPASREMEFGSVFAKSIEDGKPLVEVPKACSVEHPFSVMFGKLKLVGYADSFCVKTNRTLHEYKTGKKAWNQKRVDTHGQIDMYLLMNFITNKVKPEEVDCWLHWIPTQDNGDFTISFVKPVKVHSFKTKRTMGEVLQFGTRINQRIREMERFAYCHK